MNLPPVLKLGRNAWQSARADRAAFLIDADAFYRAFAEALLQAKKQIFIIGWDTDSRTELPRPENLGGGDLDMSALAPDKPLKLGAYLSALARARPDLEIRVLSWDFMFIYLFERESLPGLKFSALAEDRVRFVLDREHPALASHHQKIVVVDDRIAFSGGLDITQRRWDTPEHLSFDERRVDPGGHSYGPFHDVQLCVEGNVARVLGDLARERWKIATGENVQPVEQSPQSLEEKRWPKSAVANLSAVDVGISRTLPMGYFGEGSRPIIEVERLFLDTIRAARKFIYIENQYFTSVMVAKAIAARLREPDGPEVILVLPRDQTGWIEESTMGLLRSDALRIVEEADRFGRFKCYYPIVPGMTEGYVKVHSKVMVVDDEFVRVGSANMNSRSMGLDTECDLSVEAHGRSDVIKAIEGLRTSLICEHLAAEPAAFKEKFAELGSLTKAIEAFRIGPRTFVELHPTEIPLLSSLSPPKDWIDPSGPWGIRRWFGKRLRRFRYAFMVAAAIIAIAFAFFAISQGKPEDSTKELFLQSLRGLRTFTAQDFAVFIARFRSEYWAVPIILFLFIVGGFILVPVTALILGVALVYPAPVAILLSGLGAMLSALASYAIGRYWAWTKSRFLNRAWVQSVADRLGEGGVWAVAAVRLTPVAPFSAVGIVAGGLRVRLKAYMIGSLIGLLPGLVAISSLVNSTSANEAWITLVWAILTVAMYLLAMNRMTKFSRGF
jgi:phospholipase D1/2